MTVSNWIRKNASTILTFLGAGGAITTVVLAVKATPKAIYKIQNAEIDKGEEILNADLEGKVKKNHYSINEWPKLSVAETVKVCWKDYIPTLAVGTASLACIFGANVLNRKQQESMAAAYAALASAFEGYRDKVNVICGPGTEKAIEKAIEQEKSDIENDRPPWNETQTFYLSYGGKPEFFERTMEQVLKAEYELNRRFVLSGEVHLNDFLDILGLDHVEGGDEIGWEGYIGEALYGYLWIDFHHRYYVTDDGLSVCSIEMPFEPHSINEEMYHECGL